MISSKDRPTVFLSHSGNDREHAGRIANSLKALLVNVVIDIEALAPGDNFVEFMSNSLEESDYCVALWSKNVSQGSFVWEEISAAYARAVKDQRVFLILGRLDDSKIPMLLESRVFVEFFPEELDGINKLVALLERDSSVRISTGKELIPAPKTPEGDATAELYVCSSVFDRSVVLKFDLARSGGDLLLEVTRVLDLPSSVDHQGRVGVNLKYRLRGSQDMIQDDAPLHKQQINNRDVIWLEVEVTAFAVGQQVGDSVYRDTAIADISQRKLNRALDDATESLSNVLLTNGVRRRPLIRADLQSRLVDS